MKRFKAVPTTGGVYTIKDNYGMLDYLQSFYTYDKRICELFCNHLNDNLLTELPFFSTLIGGAMDKEDDIKRFIFDNFGFIDGLNVLLLNKILIITCISDVRYDEDNLKSFSDLLGLSFYSTISYIDFRITDDDVKYMYYLYVLDKNFEI